MEQTAAYERLKAVIPIHPADSTKYNIYKMMVMMTLMVMPMKLYDNAFAGRGID